MARGRMISKSLSTSKKYAALYPQPLGEFCQALYPLLVSHADDFGRLEGDVFTIKHSVVPASPRSDFDIQEALTLLDRVKLVVWYEVDAHAYLQIVDFERHQSGLHKRTVSRFPRVPGKSGKSRQLPLQLNRTEGNGREPNRNTSSAADASRPSPPAEDPQDNFGVIEKIAHEAIDQLGVGHEDLSETVKSLCATRHITYNSAVVTSAIRSAEVQRSLH